MTNVLNVTRLIWGESTSGWLLVDHIKSGYTFYYLVPLLTCRAWSIKSFSPPFCWPVMKPSHGWDVGLGLGLCLLASSSCEEQRSWGSRPAAGSRPLVKTQRTGHKINGKVLLLEAAASVRAWARWSRWGHGQQWLQNPAPARAITRWKLRRNHYQRSQLRVCITGPAWNHEKEEDTLLHTSQMVTHWQWPEQELQNGAEPNSD